MSINLLLPISTVSVSCTRKAIPPGVFGGSCLRTGRVAAVGWCTPLLQDSAQLFHGLENVQWCFLNNEYPRWDWVYSGRERFFESLIKHQILISLHYPLPLSFPEKCDVFNCKIIPLWTPKRFYDGYNFLRWQTEPNWTLKSCERRTEAAGWESPGSGSGIQDRLIAVAHIARVDSSQGYGHGNAS